MQLAPEIYASGSSAAVVPTGAMVREIRGSLFRMVDPRFTVVMLLSLFFHSGLVYYMYHVKLPVKQAADIEKVPERFAKLIIEKPIPKTIPKKAVSKTAPSAEGAFAPGRGAEATPASGQKAAEGPAPKISEAQRTRARQAVAARAARVEKMVRSVGVLGMLTGTGATARGPAVVDVLGSMGDRTESSGSLEEALSKMNGLQRAGNVEVLQQKLVKSKDVAVQHKEEIDDLVASIGAAKSVDLVKRGEFVIQRPESIEGAASSNAKRDNSAINALVSSHKASIRMSYEKYLRRNPALNGKVTVRFTIAASGAVTAVTIVENTTGSADLEQEIVRKVRLWEFDAIPEGDVTVTYPFVFMLASG